MTLLPSYRQKIFLWIGMSVVIIIGAIVGIIGPTKRMLNAVKQEIETTEKNIQNDEYELRSTIANQKHAAEIEQALATIQTAYISKNNPIDFISRLEQLADEHHVGLDFNLDTDDTSSTSPDTTSTTAVPTIFTLTGTLSDCFGFIQAALQDPAYVTITTIKIAPAASTASNHVMVTISALTYWK